MESERASSVYCMPWKFAQSVPDLQKLCIVDHLKTPASVSSPLCEAMEFLLTDEELKKVKKLLPKIAKKHGLQCSLLECSKGAPSCKSSKGGKGKDLKVAKAPAKTQPSMKAVKRKGDSLDSPCKRMRPESSPQPDYTVFPEPRPGSPVNPPSAAERGCLNGLVDKLYELAPEEVDKVMNIYLPVIIDNGESYGMDLDRMTRNQRRMLLETLQDRLFERRCLVLGAAVCSKL